MILFSPIKATYTGNTNSSRKIKVLWNLFLTSLTVKSSLRKISNFLFVFSRVEVCFKNDVLKPTLSKRVGAHLEPVDFIEVSKESLGVSHITLVFEIPFYIKRVRCFLWSACFLLQPMQIRWKKVRIGIFSSKQNE